MGVVTSRDEHPFAIYRTLQEAGQQNPLTFLAQNLIMQGYRLVNRKSLRERAVLRRPPETFTLINLKDYVFISQDVLSAKNGFKVELIRGDGSRSIDFVDQFSEITGVLKNVQNPLFLGDVLIRILPL